MLNKATIDAIAQVLNINAEELATGITSEKEVEFSVPTGTFLTKEDRTLLEDNLEKKGYDRGAIASREMVLKDMSKAVGFDESVKDATKFIEKYKANILEQAQVEPNDKIQTLESTIESLRGKIEEKDRDYQSLQGKIKQNELKGIISSSIPNLPENLGLSKDEAISLFLGSHNIKDDGVYKGDNLIVDDVHKALELKNVVGNWVESKGWNKLDVQKPNGRGGGQKGNPSSLPTTYEDYVSELKTRGLTEASAEGQALLSEIAKEHPEVLD